MWFTRSMRSFRQDRESLVDRLGATLPKTPVGVIRGVLFDLDGTLLDTLEDIARSANEVLQGLGLPPHPIDAYRRFIGDGVGNLFQRAFPAGVEDAGLVD